MKTDFYTKALLTLITLFLGVLAFDKVYEAAIPEAQARNAGKWKCFTLNTGYSATKEMNTLHFTPGTVFSFDPKFGRTAEAPGDIFCGWVDKNYWKKGY